MGITVEQALEHVDPNITDENARKQSAQRIVDGVAANEVYWNHRSDLDALRAQADGHGVVQRGSDNPEGEPPASVSTTASGPVIESTATEEPATALSAGENATGSGGVVPSPDNPNDAIAKLRQQLTDAGITPGA